MSATMEKLEKNVVMLEMEISDADFENAMQRSYIKNVKQFNIPGFRKGKAPRKIVEKMYGKEIFYDDAINFVFPQAYEDAIKETKVEPVDRPEVDIKQFPGEEQPLILTAKVTVKPDVRMSKLDDIEITKPVHTVTDEDVEKELKSMQERNARIETVEGRAAQEGDTVVIDFEGSVDGVPFEGGKGENYHLELGSGQFIPGFEDQLVGKNAGEDVAVNVTFPEEYHAEELAGKPALFQVRIHEIKAKELPKLDDEFAKDVSEFDTLDELRVDILNKLKDNAEKQTEQEIENAVIEEAVKRMKVDIPEIMFENQVEELIRDFDMRLSYQGMNVERYLQYTGMDMAAFRGQFRERAEKQVKSRLALEAVARKEKVKANKEDIKAEYDKLAEQYKMDVEKVKQYVDEEDLKKDIIMNKVVKLLIEKATIA